MTGDSTNDTESLRAALALYGDWDSELDALLGLSSPTRSPQQSAAPSTPSPSKKKKNPRSVAKPSEYRRKREAYEATRAELVTQIRALTHILKQEKKRFPKFQQRWTGEELALSREWENMATSQRRQRRAVEAERSALQALCLSQQKIARKLVDLTKKASAVHRSLGSAGLSVSIQNYCGPTKEIAQQLDHLDRLFARTGEVATSAPFSVEVPTAFHDVGFRDIGCDGIQVEYAACWELPFGVDKVADVVWAQVTRMEHRGRNVSHDHALVNATVLVSSFASAPHSYDSPGCNHGQVIDGTTYGQTALRQYANAAADGSVILVSANAASIVDAKGKRTGEMTGEGWICVEAVGPGAITDTTRALSRVKWCHRISCRPHGYDAVSSDDRARWVYSAVTGPMRKTWEEKLEQNIQAVENTLLLRQ